MFDIRLSILIAVCNYPPFKGALSEMLLRSHQEIPTSKLVIASSKASVSAASCCLLFLSLNNPRIKPFFAFRSIIP